jgi:Lipocalin-like domain
MTLGRSGREIMRLVITLAAIALGLVAAFADSAHAQTSQDFVGTWQLVSNTNVRQDGSKADIFGSNPKGLYVFTSNGHFAIVNMRPDLPKFASNNRNEGTAEENKAIVQGSIALFGMYSVADKVLTLKVEGSTWPSWTGTDQKRNFTLSGDELKWSLPASVGGTAEVVLKRIK